MRIDKYLKVSRILKKRTAGKELGMNQRLKVNGKIAKASTNIEVGDIIEISFGHRILTVQINEIKNQVRKSDPPLYTILSEQRRFESTEPTKSGIIEE